MKNAFQLMQLRRKPERGFWRVFAFLFFILVFYPSALILSARASYISKIKFQESLRAFTKGDYRSAMLGFMDVVIEEPDNDSARDYLQKSGSRVLELENGKTRLRRINLLHGAEAMKRRLVALEESKEAKTREWNRLFSRAKSLAGDEDSLREAVSAYEEFMRETPVYAELKDEFSEKDKIILGTFYETIKKRYPEMIHGRTGVDEADLGAVFFAREALDDSPDRYLNNRRTENIMAKSSHIKYLRGGVSALFNDEARALELYSGGKFAQAHALFRKVLKACGDNEEAAFYTDLAAERVSITADLAAERVPITADLAAERVPITADLAAERVSTTSNPAAERVPITGGLPSAVAREPALPESTGRSAGAQKRKNIRAAALPPKAALSALRVAPAKAVRRPRLGSSSEQDGTGQYSSSAMPLLGGESRSVQHGDVSVATPGGPAGAGPIAARDGETAAKADELYEQGVREFSVGDYKAAAKSWDECLRLNPTHAKAKLGLERLKSAGGG